MIKIVESIEIFIKYGPIGIIALMLILNYFERKSFMKVTIDSLALMNELKILLQEFLWKKDK